MEFSALLIFAGALVVAAGSPGPNVAALIARVLTGGWQSVIPFVIALWLGEAIWLSLAVWGLAAIAESLQLLFTVIKYLGVAYLLYLAWRMWASPAVIPDADLPRTNSAGRMFGAGLALALGNPKIMVFYLALLPSIIDLGAVTLIGWAELTATMLVVLIFVDLTWAALAAQARRLLRTPRAVRVTNRVSASIMAAAATAIATR